MNFKELADNITLSGYSKSTKQQVFSAKEQLDKIIAGLEKIKPTALEDMYPIMKEQRELLENINTTLKEIRDSAVPGNKRPELESLLAQQSQVEKVVKRIAQTSEQAEQELKTSGMYPVPYKEQDMSKFFEFSKPLGTITGNTVKEVPGVPQLALAKEFMSPQGLPNSKYPLTVLSESLKVETKQAKSAHSEAQINISSSEEKESQGEKAARLRGEDNDKAPDNKELVAAIKEVKVSVDKFPKKMSSESMSVMSMILPLLMMMLMSTSGKANDGGFVGKAKNFLGVGGGEGETADSETGAQLGIPEEETVGGSKEEKGGSGNGWLYGLAGLVGLRFLGISVKDILKGTWGVVKTAGKFAKTNPYTALAAVAAELAISDIYYMATHKGKTQMVDYFINGDPELKAKAAFPLKEILKQNPKTIQIDPSKVSPEMPGISKKEVGAQADAYAIMNQQVAAVESGGIYPIQSKLGFVGKYQFGEQALQDVGIMPSKLDYSKGKGRKDIMDNKENWSGPLAKEFGISSKEDFFKSKEAQERAKFIRDTQNTATFNRATVVTRNQDGGEELITFQEALRRNNISSYAALGAAQLGVGNVINYVSAKERKRAGLPLSPKQEQALDFKDANNFRIKNFMDQSGFAVAEFVGRSKSMSAGEIKGILKNYDGETQKTIIERAAKYIADSGEKERIAGVGVQVAAITPMEAEKIVGKPLDPKSTQMPTDRQGLKEQGISEEDLKKVEEGTHIIRQTTGGVAVVTPRNENDPPSVSIQKADGTYEEIQETPKEAKAAPEAFRSAFVTRVGGGAVRGAGIASAVKEKPEWDQLGYFDLQPVEKSMNPIKGTAAELPQMLYGKAKEGYEEIKQEVRVQRNLMNKRLAAPRTIPVSKSVEPEPIIPIEDKSYLTPNQKQDVANAITVINNMYNLGPNVKDNSVGQ